MANGGYFIVEPGQCQWGQPNRTVTYFHGVDLRLKLYAMSADIFSYILAIVFLSQVSRRFLWEFYDVLSYIYASYKYNQ